MISAPFIDPASGKLIFMIDASAMRESGCMRRLYWTTVSGYRGKIPANDMVYGSAFHKFAELLDRTSGNVSEALIAAHKIYQPAHYFIKETKSYLTLDHLTKTCMDYFSKVWLRKRERNDEFELLWADGQPLVEKKFCFPYMSCPQFDLLMSGTMDKLGKFRGGCYGIGDYKTTMSWGDTLKYFHSYRLDPQFRIYTLMLYKLAEMYPGSVYEEMVRGRLSFFIEGVFYSKAQPTVFERSEVFHIKKDALDRFEQILKQRVQMLAAHILQNLNTEEQIPFEEGTLNGNCQNKFGDCKFYNVCAAPDSVAQGHLLRNQFVQRYYNPLEFGEY